MTKTKQTESSTKRFTFRKASAILNAFNTSADSAPKKKEELNPFTYANNIMQLVNIARTKREVLDKFEELMEANIEVNNYSFIASLILKFSIYNNKCIENQSKLIKVFNAFDSVFFIKYFLTFCVENNIKFNKRYFKYYSCGLMDSTSKYKKYFEDNLDDNNFALLKLLLDRKLLSCKDVYNFTVSKGGKK